MAFRGSHTHVVRSTTRTTRSCESPNSRSVCSVLNWFWPARASRDLVAGFFYKCSMLMEISLTEKHGSFLPLISFCLRYSSYQPSSQLHSACLCASPVTRTSAFSLITNKGHEILTMRLAADSDDVEDIGRDLPTSALTDGSTCRFLGL